MEKFAYTPSNICLDYPWQFILDTCKLYNSVVSLESLVLPHWDEEESRGRIRESDVRVLPPPITSPPGVWRQEGLWPGREAV